MKEIILHIGMHKTGTTSIQNTIYHPSNKGVFNKNGIKYIEELEISNWVFESMFKNKPEECLQNINYGFTMEEILENNAKAKELVIKKLNESEKLLITSENIMVLSEDELANLKAFFVENANDDVEFKVVIYVRNPVSYFTSLFQQHLKMPFRKDVYSDLGILHSQYIYLENPVKVFGKESVLVYSFEDACKHKFGLAGCFFELIGFSEDDLCRLTYIRENDGMSQEALNIITFINKREPLYVNNKLNKKRTYWDFIELSNIKGSKFYLENYKIENNINNIKENLLYLKKEYGIDYTNLEKELEKNKPIENEFDELSVLNAYLLCSDFVRSEMIEYYKQQNNKELVGALEQAEKFMVKHNQLNQRHSVLLKILNLDTEKVDLPEKIAIYGLGDNGKALFNKINCKSNIVCFIDANPQVREFNNVPVIKLEDYSYQKDVKIIVTPSYAFSQIKNNLINSYSISEENIISIESIL